MDKLVGQFWCKHSIRTVSPRGCFQRHDALFSQVLQNQDHGCTPTHHTTGIDRLFLWIVSFFFPTVPTWLSQDVSRQAGGGMCIQCVPRTNICFVKYKRVQLIIPKTKTMKARYRIREKLLIGRTPVPKATTSDEASSPSRIETTARMFCRRKLLGPMILSDKGCTIIDRGVMYQDQRSETDNAENKSQKGETTDAESNR